VVVHAEAQWRAVVEELDVPADRVHLLPYGVDTDFWAPRETREAPLVVAAGREHRDYRTFADAVSGLPVVAHVTDTSSHSPTADRNHPDSWPSNVRRRALPFPALREIYGEAQVVVVPLTATDFQAGITAVLEGMAMGKPVVVSDTDGLRGVVENGQNGVTVPVGDALALRQAIARLLSDENERRRIGKCARLAAVQRWSLQRYIDGLAWILSAAESRLGARSQRSPYPGAS